MASAKVGQKSTYTRVLNTGATSLEVPITGTLGMLLAAAQSGLLPSLKDAIEAVKRCGLYVDQLLHRNSSRPCLEQYLTQTHVQSAKTRRRPQ